MGRRIVGINLAKNGALAILQDGELEFYLEEERVTKIKRDISAKALAKMYVDSDVDAVTICDCYTRYSPKTYLERTIAKNKLVNIVKQNGCNNIIDYRQRHHECHAACALHHSPFDDAAVIVMDGKGSVYEEDGLRFCETESIFDNLTSVFRHYSTFWSEEESKKIDKPYWKNGNLYSNRTSVGQAFRRVSRYCGFDEIEGGKTMGLSAYGHPDTPIDLFNEEYGHSLCSTVLSPERDTTKYTGAPLLEADLAYSLQKSAEKHAIFMVKKAMELTGKKNICVTGGFFLNCVSNYAIIKSLDINLYCDPIAYDGGNAIGSALLNHYENTLSRT